jgi:predicted metalloprotease with PDZ domain
MMGLEHLNSTVISLPPSALKGPDLSALSVTAHEFVHAWNVKRVRPEKLGPFDYTREVRVKDLWWLEGVTDYYAPRLIVEAGLAGEDYWRGYLSEVITTVQNNPARTSVTLETASLKAWEGRSEGYGGLSYYEKGLIVGLLLDIEMRRRSDNRVGTDALLDALLRETQKTGKGYPDGEIERLASQLCGFDLGPFFDKALRTTDELPYAGTLPAAGLRLHQTTVTQPDFGIDSEEVTLADGGIRLGRVMTDGPAATAGIQNGDVVTAVDGVPVSRITGALFGNKHPGDPVNLSVRRNGEQRRYRLVLGAREQVVYEIESAPDTTPEQRAIYASISGVDGRRVEHASVLP